MRGVEWEVERVTKQREPSTGVRGFLGSTEHLLLDVLLKMFIKLHLKAPKFHLSACRKMFNNHLFNPPISDVETVAHRAWPVLGPSWNTWDAERETHGGQWCSESRKRCNEDSLLSSFETSGYQKSNQSRVMSNMGISCRENNFLLNQKFHFLLIP